MNSNNQPKDLPDAEGQGREPEIAGPLSSVDIALRFMNMLENSKLLATSLPDAIIVRNPINYIREHVLPDELGGKNAQNLIKNCVDKETNEINPQKLLETLIRAYKRIIGVLNDDFYADFFRQYPQYSRAELAQEYQKIFRYLAAIFGAADKFTELIAECGVIEAKPVKEDKKPGEGEVRKNKTTLSWGQPATPEDRGTVKAGSDGFVAPAPAGERRQHNTLNLASESDNGPASVGVARGSDIEMERMAAQKRKSIPISADMVSTLAKKPQNTLVDFPAVEAMPLQQLANDANEMQAEREPEPALSGEEEYEPSILNITARPSANPPPPISKRPVDLVHHDNDENLSAVQGLADEEFKSLFISIYRQLLLEKFKKASRGGKGKSDKENIAEEEDSGLLDDLPLEMVDDDVFEEAFSKVMAEINAMVSEDQKLKYRHLHYFYCKTMDETERRAILATNASFLVGDLPKIKVEAKAQLKQEITAAFEKRFPLDIETLKEKHPFNDIFEETLQAVIEKMENTSGEFENFRLYYPEGFLPVVRRTANKMVEEDIARKALEEIQGIISMLMIKGAKIDDILNTPLEQLHTFYGATTLRICKWLYGVLPFEAGERAWVLYYFGAQKLMDEPENKFPEGRLSGELKIDNRFQIIFDELIPIVSGFCSRIRLSHGKPVLGTQLLAEDLEAEADKPVVADRVSVDDLMKADATASAVQEFSAGDAQLPRFPMPSAESIIVSSDIKNVSAIAQARQGFAKPNIEDLEDHERYELKKFGSVKFGRWTITRITSGYEYKNDDGPVFYDVRPAAGGELPYTTSVLPVEEVVVPPQAEFAPSAGESLTAFDKEVLAAADAAMQVISPGSAAPQLADLSTLGDEAPETLPTGKVPKLPEGHEGNERQFGQAVDVFAKTYNLAVRGSQGSIHPGAIPPVDLPYEPEIKMADEAALPASPEAQIKPKDEPMSPQVPEQKAEEVVSEKRIADPGSYSAVVVPPDAAPSIPHATELPDTEPVNETTVNKSWWSRNWGKVVTVVAIAGASITGGAIYYHYHNSEKPTSVATSTSALTPVNSSTPNASGGAESKGTTAATSTTQTPDNKTPTQPSPVSEKETTPENIGTMAVMARTIQLRSALEKHQFEVNTDSNGYGGQMLKMMWDELYKRAVDGVDTADQFKEKSQKLVELKNETNFASGAYYYQLFHGMGPEQLAQAKQDSRYSSLIRYLEGNIIKGPIEKWENPYLDNARAREAAENFAKEFELPMLALHYDARSPGNIHWGGAPGDVRNLADEKGEWVPFFAKGVKIVLGEASAEKTRDIDLDEDQNAPTAPKQHIVPGNNPSVSPDGGVPGKTGLLNYRDADSEVMITGYTEMDTDRDTEVTLTDMESEDYPAGPSMAGVVIPFAIPRRKRKQEALKKADDTDPEITTGKWEDVDLSDLEETPAKKTPAVTIKSSTLSPDLEKELAEIEDGWFTDVKQPEAKKPAVKVKSSTLSPDLEKELAEIEDGWFTDVKQPETKVPTLDERIVSINKNMTSRRQALLEKGEIYVPSLSEDLNGSVMLAIKNGFLKQCYSGQQQDRVEAIVNKLRITHFDEYEVTEKGTLAKLSADKLAELQNALGVAESVPEVQMNVRNEISSTVSEILKAA